MLRRSALLWRIPARYYARVRFAPSPTGHLHLGGLRTALYNHLFALANGGTTVLRIEDTDRSRVVPGAAEALVETLEWAGVRFDEGPAAGGRYGPYVQSERSDIYRKEVRTLVENGTAYKCFCTERRLNLLRRDALRHGAVPKYDNKCRHLSAEEINKKISTGDPYCVRFKLSSDILTFDDLIYGTMAFDISLTEGDPVILKADGLPTYHLANVVDDHHMEISHVLRGVEWQISTTKHLLMYKAFGWNPPQYGHLPLIVNSDGTKLSKRQGDVRVEDYRKKGVFPLSLVNYMTLAGGGFTRTSGEGITLHTMDELVSMFQLNTINASPSRLNPDLLDECNRLAIMQNAKDTSQLDKMVVELRDMIVAQYPGKKLDTSEEYIKSVVLWSSGRVKYLNDLLQPAMNFLWILPEENFSLESASVRSIEKLIAALRSVDDENFERHLLKTFLKNYTSENNLKFSDFMKLLRKVLGGLQEGPSVAEMMEVFGKENSLRRLQVVL